MIVDNTNRDSFPMSEPIIFHKKEIFDANIENTKYLNGAELCFLDCFSPEQVLRLFYELNPEEGKNNKIKLILDNGFRVQIKDDGIYQRKVFIYKSILEANEKEGDALAGITAISEMFHEAIRMNEAIPAIPMYRETLQENPISEKSKMKIIIMNVTIASRDRFSMSNFLNFQGEEEYNALKKKYQDDPDGIQLNGINCVSPEQVQNYFSELNPKGIENEIKLILDNGFRIQITDSGTSVRKVFIYKSIPEANGEEKQALARALQISEAFKQAIHMYRETYQKGQPFNFSDWYGKGKPYTNYLTGECSHQTRLDKEVNYHGVDVNIRKKEDKYRVNYSFGDKLATIFYDTM